MKRLFTPMFLLMIMLIGYSGIASASSFEIPSFVGEVILPFLFEKFPFLGYLMLVVGFFRLVFKPLMEMLEDYFGYISYDRGNRKITAIRESKIYYWISFIFDYLFSIKNKKKND